MNINAIRFFCKSKSWLRKGVHNSVIYYSRTILDKVIVHINDVVPFEKGKQERLLKYQEFWATDQ